MAHNKPRLTILFGAIACMALALSGCTSSKPGNGESGTSQPQTGDLGSWELLNASEITSESTTLKLGVTRVDCASGITGTILEPQVTLEKDRITVRSDVERAKAGVGTCQSNNVVPVTLELQEPVGNRELFDAICLDEYKLTTAFCLDGGVRWKPETP